MALPSALGIAHVAYPHLCSPLLPRVSSWPRPCLACAALRCSVVVASTYTVIEGGKMELMWEGDLHCNTVHVFDVVRAIYFAARKLEPGTSESAPYLGRLPPYPLATVRFCH